MADETKPEETKADLIKAAKGLPPTEVFSLKPRTFDEAFRFANLIAESTLIPREFQKSPANVLIAVQLGMELGVAPMQALQNIAVINGHPTIWGDLVPAIVYQSGLCEQFDEAGNDKEATCTVKRKGFAPVIRKFSWTDAQRAGLAEKQTYKQYPARMLQMRARAYAMRDAFPDVLKGVHLREEMEDDEPRDVTPAPLKTPQAITEKKEDAVTEPPRTVRVEQGNDSNNTSVSSETVPKMGEGNRLEGQSGKSRHSKKSNTVATEVKQQEAPAPQAEKSQEDLINEGFLWVEQCSDEDLMREPDNWLFEHLKKVQGWKNQLPVLQKFNDRRLSLANKS